jgi:hypothetical protein
VLDLGRQQDPHRELHYAVDEVAAHAGDFDHALPASPTMGLTSFRIWVDAQNFILSDFPDFSDFDAIVPMGGVRRLVREARRSRAE